MNRNMSFKRRMNNRQYESTGLGGYCGYQNFTVYAISFFEIYLQYLNSKKYGEKQTNKRKTQYSNSTVVDQHGISREILTSVYW